MTDFRSLCAKVLAYNEGQGKYNFSHLSYDDRDNAAFDAWQEITTELKSALSEPEPEGPQPVPAGEVADEARYLVKELRDQADDLSPSLELFSLMHRAADLLEQRQAAPVSADGEVEHG